MCCIHKCNLLSDVMCYFGFSGRPRRDWLAWWPSASDWPTAPRRRLAARTPAARCDWPLGLGRSSLIGRPIEASGVRQTTEGTRKWCKHTRETWKHKKSCSWRRKVSKGPGERLLERVKAAPRPRMETLYLSSQWRSVKVHTWPQTSRINATI